MVPHRLRGLCLALVILGLSACTENRQPAPRLRVGNPAREFSAQDLNGQTWTLDKVKGKIVLLRFWADWCSSCRIEIPVLEKLFQGMGPQGFMVLAVNVNQSRQVSEVFATQMNITFPILLDPEGQLAKRYGVYAIPMNFLIDRQGVIREILVGEVFRDEKFFKNLMQTYFPEKPALH